MVVQCGRRVLTGCRVGLSLTLAGALLAGCTPATGRTAARSSPMSAATSPTVAASQGPTATAQPLPRATITTQSARVRAAALPGLVWASARVPAAVVAAADSLAPSTAVVRVADGTAWLPVKPGSSWSWPIDVAAADPTLYAAAMPAAQGIRTALRPHEVVLAADEARLRHVGVGDHIAFPAVDLRVALIVPDALIGYSEMFVEPSDGKLLGLAPDRYLLIRPASAAQWPDAVARIRATAATGTPLRFVAPGRARALRQADAVLAPLQEELRFGEFAALPHPSASGDLTIEPSWLAAHLVTTSVPILGNVTCNRAFVPALRAALNAVVAAGLQGLIDRTSYGGCFSARLIARQPGAPISHHAFGSALDLNVRRNPQGQPPHQDPRLVAIFAREGITWGGGWLVPDGMHFEALRTFD